SSTDNKAYRIGLGPWVGFGPLYLAKERGYFDEAGLDIDLIVLTGLAERNSALKAGRIDALAAPVDYFVLSAGHRLATTIVMAIDESAGGDGIVARKNIKRFEDLRGKKVAFQRGLPSEFFLRALLQQHGVKLEEMEFTDLETADAGAAFIAGKVDAAVVWEPWLTQAKERGNGHVLASTQEYPDLIVDCLAFTKEVVARSPQDVQKIVSAVLKAIGYWKQNPEEANRIMAPHFQLDPAKYALILSGARFTDLARNREYFGDAWKAGPIFEVARRASDIWLAAKVIEVPVKPEAIITTKFVSGGGK
ncbi:MAG: ABC transporter substrate-binding protein, partial [Gammaproteobacteria bacterium]